ncbi:MAG: TonB family protein [Nannocystaceae bacterium]|nr:TonB family protein [Nannocystaceae bacterium]
MFSLSENRWSSLLCLLTLLWAVACTRDDPQSEPAQDPADRPSLVQHTRTPVMPKVEWRASASERVPMSLTAGDGSGLQLRSVSGTVVIEDPVAFTELHLVFHNPQPRRREGRFEVDLPPQAAFSRLAMKIGGDWMEGEVVERARARRTFESFIHQRPRVDPALLEKTSANRVSARVFPIEPLADKEIIVSYSQPLIGEHGGYRLPLTGLPQLDALDVRVIVKTAGGETSDRFMTASQRVVEISERNFAPHEDLFIALDGSGLAAGVRSENVAAVRVRLPEGSRAQAVGALTVLFDTSASTAGAFDQEVSRLEDFLAGLPPSTSVRVVAFDQEVELVFDGEASHGSAEELAGLRRRRAFGASDLGAALGHPLLAHAKGRRLLIWSDGIATAGQTVGASLAKLAGGLRAERIDAYATTLSADRSLLSGLAAAAPRSGFVVGPGMDGTSLAHRLTDEGFDGVRIEVPGAQWSYPRSLEGLAPGDDIVVYARFEANAPASVEVGFSDARLGRHVVSTLEGASPLVERAVATARASELTALLETTGDPAAVFALREDLLELSLRHRILTSQTALLVLESEGEYRRYGIDRTGLADILTVGPGGIDLLRRGGGPTGTTLADNNAVPRMGRAFDPDAAAEDLGILGLMQSEAGHFLASPNGGAFAVGDDDEDVWGGLMGTEVGEAFGVGGLGLSGTGRGGSGTGGGTIGLGNTGLIGRGGGTGSGYGYGYGAGRRNPIARTAGGFGGRGSRVPVVRPGKATVMGGLDKDIVRRVVRVHLNEVRHCYNRALSANPEITGRVEVEFVVSPAGRVLTAVVAGSSLGNDPAATCIAKAVKRWKFPKPRSAGAVTIRYPFVMTPGAQRASARSQSGRSARQATRPRRRRGDPSDGPQWVGSAQSGRFAALQRLVAEGEAEEARSEAWAWATSQPGNALAIVALGEMLEIEGKTALAARVYGSLIDLYPGRADMRRAAGARLEAVGPKHRALALDTYRKAVKQRPDQINGHRLLAWALVKGKKYEEAFEVLGDALQTPTPAGRFNGVKTLLRQDRELLVAAWLADTADANPSAQRRIRAAGVRPATSASLRLVADWETDATDVDLLVDPIGRGDGRRHADVRDGFGPEAWISSPGKVPPAVSARVRYFDRGAMGYAMGTVSAVRHDGEGNLTFVDRPFVIMEARGSVELGRFRT